MALDIGAVAFSGFRLIARKPWVVLIWAAAYLVALIGLMLVAFAILAASGGNFAPTSAANEPPAAMWLMFPVVLAGFLAIWSLFTAAAYRMVLRPEDSGFGYLRFGMTELRLLGLFGVSALLWFALLFAISMFVTLLSLGTAGGSAALALLLWLPGLALAAFLSVRFSLAGVINFSEGRFGLADSWRLTRGVFWPLFGVYAILAALILAVFIGLFLLSAISQSAAGMASGFSGLATAGDAGFGGPALAVTIVGLLINLLISTANMIWLNTPHAAAYLALKPPPRDQTVDVFS